PKQHIEKSDQILFRESLSAGCQCLFFFGIARNLFFQTQLHKQKIPNPADELPDVLLHVQALIDDDTDVFEKRLRVALGQSIHRALEDFTGNEAENVADVFIDDFLAAERNDLIQQRLRI